MSAWNIVLPHRLLVNRSLRKASADLHSHIDDYKVEYEQTIERCTEEIEQARSDKDRDFDKVQLSLIEELSKDSSLYEKVQKGLLEYADLFLRRQCQYKIRDIKRLEKQSLDEYIGFLTEQMGLIGDEVGILEVRKDKLVAQAKVDDIIVLIGLSGCEITIDSNDNALSLLTKVSEVFSTCDESNPFEKQALHKLRTVLQERVDLLPVIQYISWTIQLKIQLSRQLSGERRRITAERNDKASEVQVVSDSIATLNHSLDEQARTVREYWAFPITQLNIQISFLYRKLNDIYDEIKDIGTRIEHMKRISSDDSLTWDRLWREKNDLKEQIPEVKSEIKSLKNERQQWFERQRMLYSLCTRYNVRLIPDGKAKESDEYRIISNRLAELHQVEEEANRRENERFTQESGKIQQERKAKIGILSAQIAIAEKNQSEMDTIFGQAANQLSSSKSRDSRLFILKWFSDTDEVSKAKQGLQIATSQKRTADSRLSTLKAELVKVTKEFDRQLNACRPKPYRPTFAESAEREKLENRRTEMLNQQSQKRSARKEECYDSSN